MNFCKFNADESDDDDDFLIDSSDNNDYRTNSSSSSLVWSAEARKQNEEDWLQIERILYGEEELPEDEKSREEFVEWMEAFPHLRIIGTKYQLPARKQLNYSPPHNFVDEIIAIDPPPSSESFRNLDFELNEKLSIRRARQSANGARHVRDEELEKFLRVTSSGVARNQQVSRKTVDKTIVMRQQGGGKLSRIHENRKLHFGANGNVGMDEKFIIHSAAAPARPPQQHHNDDVKFVYKKPNRVTFDEVKAVKSASKLPMYAEISRIEPMKMANKSQIASKSASIHHQRRANLNTIRLPPFSYDLDYPYIEVRGFNNQKSSLPKH